MRKWILGTDWWTDCDDAVAMRLLARAHKAGDIHVEGIVINACMEHSVSSLDGFLCREGVEDIPIGIDLRATDFGGRPPYQKSLSAYARRYRSNEEACEAVSLYRKILSEATEKVEILEIGYLQVMESLLKSGPDAWSPASGLELVREKVSRMWVMAGKWDVPEGVENNFARNARARRAASYFCAHCPVPVTFLGFEVGVDVLTGEKLEKSDYLWEALRDHGSPNGRSSWDPMLVMLALIGDAEKAGYRCVRGTATVDAETGANRFLPSVDGRHSFVVKAKENAFYADWIEERIRSKTEESGD